MTHKKWSLLEEGAVGEGGMSRPATGSGARDSHRDSQSQHMIRDSQLRQDRCLVLRQDRCLLLGQDRCLLLRQDRCRSLR